MKKLLTLFTAIILFNVSFAADTAKADPATIDTATLNAKKIFTQVYGDVKSGIAGLASALKVGSEHVYHVVTKQQTANSIIYISIALVLLIASKITYNHARNNNNAWKTFSKENPTADRTDDSSGVSAVIYTVATIGLGIACATTLCINMQTIVIGFANPEYGAIKEIISFIK